MLKVKRQKRQCPEISSEVTVEFQVVEVNGKALGPEHVIGCDSKHICQCLYEDEGIAIKLNWSKCAFNRQR